MPVIPPFREKKMRKRRVNRWAIGFIMLFFVSMLVLLFFQSPFSKIRHIVIDGNVTLDQHEILDQVSLTTGLQFFEWDREAAARRLMENEQVKDVVVTKSFPGKITIKVTEWPRVAFWLQTEGDIVQSLRPVLENGTILSEPWTGQVDKPLLRGWKNKSDIQAMSEQLARVDPEILRSLSEIHPQQSDTYPDEVRVFTDEGNEIRTRISTFKDTISQYRYFIEPGKKGIVHMTYSNDFGWFEPYEKEEADGERNDEEQEAP